MQYAILLEKQADGHYAASVPMLPGLTKIGASGMETLQAIRQAITNTLQQRELVYLDVPISSNYEQTTADVLSTGQDWLPFAGKWVGNDLEKCLKLVHKAEKAYCEGFQDLRYN